MTKGRAVAIFANIQDKCWSTEEKAIAIKTVLKMATHSSITKDEMLGVIAWLLDQAFEFEDE